MPILHKVDDLHLASCQDDSPGGQFDWSGTRSSVLDDKTECFKGRLACFETESRQTAISNVGQEIQLVDFSKNNNG